MPDSAWPMYGQNAQHTGVGLGIAPTKPQVAWRFQAGQAPLNGSPAIGPDGTIVIAASELQQGTVYALRPDGKLRWKRQCEWSITADAVIGRDGTVYIHTDEGSLQALAAANGRQLWQSGGGVGGFPPAVDEAGTIYLGSADDGLIALSPSGALLWTAQTAGACFTPTVAGSNRILVGCADGLLYAFSAQGQLLWQCQTDGVVSSRLEVAADGSVVAQSETGVLQHISADGQLLWSRPIGNPQDTWPLVTEHGLVYACGLGPELHVYDLQGTPQPVIPLGGTPQTNMARAADGTLYVGCDDQTLYALDPAIGVRWRYVAGSELRSTPAVDAQGTIYFGSGGGVLTALEPDGRVRWRFATSDGRPLYGAPSLGPDDTIYVGCDDGKLYAVNPDGSCRWSFPTGLAVQSTPAIAANGDVFFGSVDQSAYAVRADGTERWRLPTGGWVSNPIIGPGDMLFVGSHDAHLYAIREDGKVQWKTFLNGPLPYAPALGNDDQLCVVANRELYALDAGTGLVRWSYTNVMGVQGTPAIGPDGHIFVRSTSHSLVSLTPHGVLNWAFEASGSVLISDPALTPDSTIVVGADDAVYALHADGTRKWRFAVPVEAVNGVGSLAIDRGGDVIFSTPSRLYRLGPDGVLKWKLRIGNLGPFGPIIGRDGSLYVGCINGQLCAIRQRRAAR